MLFSNPWEYKQESFFLINKDKSLHLLFSNRSLQREKKVFEKIILNSLKNTHHTILLIPWHHDFISVLESFHKNQTNLKKIIFLIAANFSPNKQRPHNETFIENENQWNFWLNELKGNEKFDIVVHPGITKLEDFSSLIQNDLRKAAARIKTIDYLRHTWEYNEKRNRPLWKKAYPLAQYKPKAPPLLLTAGPSLNIGLNSKLAAQKISEIWCADTALKPVLNAGFFPRLVFSIDPGFASTEHFMGIDAATLKKLDLVVDPLSNGNIWEMNINQKYSYSTSNPFARGVPADWPFLTNLEGDVTGAMIATSLFFGFENAAIIGHDKKAVHLISHARGTAYSRRFLFHANRLNTQENYFKALSTRYRN